MINVAKASANASQNSLLTPAKASAKASPHSVGVGGLSKSNANQPLALSVSVSKEQNDSTCVPRGAFNRSATAPIQRAGDCHNDAPATLAHQELKGFANEVLAICGHKLLGRVPEGFVGPPVSGPARLTRLA